MTRDHYLAMRRRFQPEQISLVIVAESPPVSGRYFYDTTGKVGEPLFAAIMLQAGIVTASKEDGLRQLQAKGWLLVDATYQPVDKRPDRDDVILADYPQLRDDLAALAPERIVLIKANVCRLLEPRLRADGFNVINDGRDVHFPANGWQPDFHREFAEIAAQ